MKEIPHLTANSDFSTHNTDHKMSYSLNYTKSPLNLRTPHQQSTWSAVFYISTEHSKPPLRQFHKCNEMNPQKPM